MEEIVKLSASEEVGKKEKRSKGTKGFHLKLIIKLVFIILRRSFVLEFSNGKMMGSVKQITKLVL